MKGPLLTLRVHQALRAAATAGRTTLECSLDLDRSIAAVEVDSEGFVSNGQRYPYLESCRDRTVYAWMGTGFEPVARYTNALIKLVPTEWGPPTFEIDGIKMLPTARVSPYADAERKVALVQPRGKIVLDTCGGLGYFAGACLQAQAARVVSFEKNSDVLWLRTLNPWSPDAGEIRLESKQGDVTAEVRALPDSGFDAALHDPPRFGIAGELYSQVFYDQLARVLRRRGKLFHYVGTPNKLTSGRDVPNEVATRLRRAGFVTQFNGDGIVAVKR